MGAFGAKPSYRFVNGSSIDKNTQASVDLRPFVQSIELKEEACHRASFMKADGCVAEVISVICP